MVDAIREILGLRPLYSVERGEEPAVRIAQDRIDAAAALHGRTRGMPESIIDDWRID